MAHTTLQELLASLQLAEKKVPRWSVRVHRAAATSDKSYIIHDLIINEEDEGVLVVYQPQYEDWKDLRFARPISAFLETIQRKDGTCVQRFQRIS